MNKRAVALSSHSQLLIRFLLLGLGGAGAALAIWTFYFRAWLDILSPLDAWLEKTRCLVANWCTPQFDLPHHLAMLAVMVAALCFGLALRRQSDLWRRDRPPDLPLAWPESIWSRRVLAVSLLLAAGAFILEAYQTLTGITPSAPVWLAGIGACVLAAGVWDWQHRLEFHRTLANLTVAVALTLIILGVAGLVTTRPGGLYLLIAGALTFGLGSRWTVRLGSSMHPLEHVTMLGLSLVALLLVMSRAWSWRFAFIGDEWVFFEMARVINHRPDGFELLALRDTVGYHTILSFTFQSWIMALAGENVFGWRLASSLPFVLSLPPIYIFVRWLAGRGAAFLGTGLLAGAHVLQTFSMAAYNNTQALLPLTLGLGLFAFAAVRASLLRYMLIGIVAGIGLFTFGLSRLAVIPLGVLLLSYFWPLRRGYLPGWGPVILGGLVASAPILFNLGNWQALLKATPLQSEVTARGISVGLQIVRNAVLGGLAFVTNDHKTHFIAGPYAEPLTALLVLLGLGYVLAGIGVAKRARVWLVASGLFVLAVSSIQQYGFVSPTRLFILPPIYAIYAGLGGMALVYCLFPKDGNARSALLGIFVAAAAGLNLFHIERISLPNNRWPVETLMMQQFQATAAPDRGGMPVFAIMEPHRGLRMNLIATGYDVGRERLIFLRPDEALNLPHLCQAAQEPAMVLVDIRIGPVDAIRERVAGCWPGYSEVKIYNKDAEVVLYRFLTEPGQHEFAGRKRDRRSNRQNPDTLTGRDPGDLVIDAGGTVFVLSPDRERIYRFGPDGRSLGSFAVAQQNPSALAVTAEGYLLVASPHGENRLVWYDAGGQVIRRLRPELSLGSPRGLAVRPNGEILVADEQGGRVVRLSAAGEIIVGEYIAGGKIGQPFSVAVSPDGSVWVVDAGGQLLHISPRDELLGSYPLPHTSVDRMRRLVPTTNGDLLMTEPNDKRVVRLDVQGRPVRVWNGFERPVAIAVDSHGRLYVADWALDQIAILPPIAAPLRPAVLVKRAIPTSVSTELRSTQTLIARRVTRQALPPLTLELTTQEKLTIITSPDPAGLKQPRGIAVGPNGWVYVTDTGNRRLLILDENGTYVKQATGGGTPFGEPFEVAVDSRGRVYVVDAEQGRLNMFTPEGAYLLDVPLDSAYLGRSRGLFIDHLDRIWLAGTSAGRLVGSDLGGNVFLEFVPDPKTASQPIDVAVGLDDTIFVTDGILHQLLRFDAEGKLQTARELPTTDTVTGPHLAVDARGALYMTDPQEGLIHQFSPAGHPLVSWPLLRPDGNRMRPVGIALDPQGRIWTVDTEGNSIVRLDISGGTN